MSRTSTASFAEPMPREMADGLLARAVAKAGVAGAYAEADSELGRRVSAIASEGGSVYLWGKPGRGKTYAAAQAVRDAVMSGYLPECRQPAALCHVSRTLAAMRRDIDEGESWRVPFLERVPLLALDDLGAERMTEWAVEQVASIIDARSFAGLPTIVTSNLSVGELREAVGGIQGARLASRLSAYERIEATGMDRRTA